MGPFRRLPILLMFLAWTVQITVGANRTFTIDYERNTFLMDGKPFRFVSGSFHYFRALPGSWRQILRSMRAAGLAAVMTYIEWSTHEPTVGKYVWEGIGNLEQFIQIAKEENLYVILRPGPYICAERDMGGFPYWLLTKYPNIKLRTYDQDFLREVAKWYGTLMPRIQKYLYGRGGPVIMVSIENEYGSFAACDGKYMSFLKNLTESYVGNNAVLFTNDGPNQLKCGSIPGVLATLDFGTTSQPEQYWQILRKFQPRGPLMNAEFYPGWLTHWMEPIARVATEPVVSTLKKMLDQGANVNFYMFFGGTNFGFTAGANDGGPGKFEPDITSYDYDAPLDEAGDPTPKYFAIRNMILKYFPDPGVPVPVKLPKMKLDPVTLRRYGSLLSDSGLRTLARYSAQNQNPLSFEALNQNSGLILYETIIPNRIHREPMLLKVNSLRDRAYVHVNGKCLGVLSRGTAIDSIPISMGIGNRLQLMVENEGRINYRIPNDFKGILGKVTLDNSTLVNWTMTGFPLDNYLVVQKYINEFSENDLTEDVSSPMRVFHGIFKILTSKIDDTYLDTRGWGKGVAFINGFNLGRYWPLVGPQMTLYVPRHILRRGDNTITMIEYQKDLLGDAVIKFSDKPNFNGP